MSRLRRLLRRPHPATVLAALALVVALSSPAVAARLVTSADIANNTIRSVDVRNGQIRSSDIADRGIARGDLSLRALNANRLDGLDSSAFQRSCTRGTVVAWAVVAARTTFPNVWTSDPTLVPLRHACAGTPEVRRTGTGVYLVRVSNLDLSPTMAVGSSYGALEAADNSVAVRRITYEGIVVWQVVVRDVAAGRVPEDGEFVIAIL